MRPAAVITLYGPRQSPFTEKVRRALIYKGYEFEIVEPETVEDYKRMSPKTGQLPALDFHGEHVPDSTDIILRLEADRPQPPLLSVDPTVASQQRQLEDWADESFLFYYLRYRRLVDPGGMALPLRQDPSTPPPEPPREPSGRLRRFRAWLRAGGTWERPETAVLRGLGDRMNDLINFLGGRPFFYSDSLSMADLAVYSMLSILRMEAIPGASLLLGARPPLVAFMSRVEERTGG